MNLPEILHRCRSGDELAWETLVRAYQGRIYALALGYVGNAEEARDLAQEAFVRIYRSLPSCRDPQRFLPWAIRIARNVCVDHIRRRAARPPMLEVPLEAEQSLASEDPNPEEHAIARSRRALVYRALRMLSALSREMIILREIQGLPHEEISSLLRIPVGTVKSRANRARLELAKAVLTLSGPDEEA